MQITYKYFENNNEGLIYNKNINLLTHHQVENLKQKSHHYTIQDFQPLIYQNLHRLKIITESLLKTKKSLISFE